MKQGDDFKMAIRKLKPITFTIDINKIALNQRKFNTEEIGRGIGIHKVSKGNGSYTRKEKHKRKPQNDNETSFYFWCVQRSWTILASASLARVITKKPVS
jgi:hypothetical protein